MKDRLKETSNERRKKNSNPKEQRSPCHFISTPLCNMVPLYEICMTDVICIRNAHIITETMAAVTVTVTVVVVVVVCAYSILQVIQSIAISNQISLYSLDCVICTMHICCVYLDLPPLRRWKRIIAMSFSKILLFQNFRIWGKGIGIPTNQIFQKWSKVS